MPTNKPRITITIPEDLMDQIEDYRFAAKCKNQTQAINELIKKGLDTIGPIKNYPSKSVIETAEKIQSLDAHGKKVLKLILDEEYRNTQEHLMPVAAHEIEGSSPEAKKHDDGIMESDDF